MTFPRPDTPVVELGEDDRTDRTPQQTNGVDSHDNSKPDQSSSDVGDSGPVDGPTGHQDAVAIDFVTLGMFIIDDIDFVPPKPPVKDVLGGAGSYSALGARLFSPPPLSTTVGWVIDQGSDFPATVTSLIESWNTTAVMRHDPDRLTTRGWNGYEGDEEKRAFRYLTPKKRLTADDLTPCLLQSRSFHLICSPIRCQQLVTEITARRKAAADPDSYTKPIFIWEPVPDLCTPDELLNCTNTLRLIDVCSPNHTELAGFMGDDGLDPDTGRISTSAIERSCEQLLASMPLKSFTLIVRAGEKGCYIAKNAGTRIKPPQGGGVTKRRKKHYAGSALHLDMDMEALFAGLLQDEDGTAARDEIETDPGLDRWIPACHQDSSKVVDPTGGGNTFLGGLGVALARGESPEEAAIWASVAASFAIEQIGMPTLSVDDQSNETWNDVRVDDRLRDFRALL